jgi:hypothetical protein
MSGVGGAECLQAASGGLQLGIAAAFLLDQVELDSAVVFGCLENRLPISFPFSK